MVYLFSRWRSLILRLLIEGLTVALACLGSFPLVSNLSYLPGEPAFFGTSVPFICTLASFMKSDIFAFFTAITLTSITRRADQEKDAASPALKKVTYFVETIVFYARSPSAFVLMGFTTSSHF